MLIGSKSPKNVKPTKRFGLFIGLHFELETGPFFPRPDRIFQSGLRSQLTRPYGPVFFTVSKKGSGLGPDRTVASLALFNCTTVLSFP